MAIGLDLSLSRRDIAPVTRLTIVLTPRQSRRDLLSAILVQESFGVGPIETFEALGFLDRMVSNEPEFETKAGDIISLERNAP